MFTYYHTFLISFFCEDNYVSYLLLPLLLGLIYSLIKNKKLISLLVSGMPLKCKFDYVWNSNRKYFMWIRLSLDARFLRYQLLLWWVLRWFVYIKLPRAFKMFSSWWETNTKKEAPNFSYLFWEYCLSWNTILNKNYYYNEHWKLYNYMYA